MKTSLILFRHGQPQLQNCLLGRTDSKLSALGWQQMEEISSEIQNIDLVITSPLLRCKQFAVEFASKNAIPFECEEDWQECNFGDWDGLSYEKLYQENTEPFEKFISNPEKHGAPNGESLTDFKQRIDQALNRILKEHKGKTILLVSHAGVIRNLIAWAIGIERLSNKPYQRYSIDYASVSQIDVFDDTGLFSQLKYMNKVAEVSLK